MKYEEPSIECFYLTRANVVVTSFLFDGSDSPDFGDWGDYDDSGSIVLPPIPLN